jgi:tetratricopeptide (TPR) repeat protein
MLEMKGYIQIYILLLIIFSSCNSENEMVYEKETNETHSAVSQDSLQIAQQEKVLDLLGTYENTGDTSILSQSLEYCLKANNQPFVTSDAPLYTGLIYELLNEKEKAIKYYEESKRLADHRILNPSKVVMNDFDAKSEKDLKERIKGCPYSLKELKQAVIQKEQLILAFSETLLGVNKIDEINELVSSKKDMIIPFSLMQIKYEERKDIFKLIDDWYFERTFLY